MSPKLTEFGWRAANTAFGNFSISACHRQSQCGIAHSGAPIPLNSVVAIILHFLFNDLRTDETILAFQLLDRPSHLHQHRIRDGREPVAVDRKRFDAVRVVLAQERLAVADPLPLERGRARDGALIFFFFRSSSETR